MFMGSYNTLCMVHYRGMCSTIWQRLWHAKIHHCDNCQQSTQIVVIYQPNLRLIATVLMLCLSSHFLTSLNVCVGVCGCGDGVLTFSAVLSKEARTTAPLQCCHASLGQSVGWPDKSPVAGQHVSQHE